MNKDSAPENDKTFKRLLIGGIAVVLLVGAIAGGYLLSLRAGKGATVPAASSGPQAEMATIQVYFPVEGRLQHEERQVPRALSRLESARAAMEEFLKGPSGKAGSPIPEGATLLDIYDGEDGVLYVDLSDAFRRNLEVDALSEFLLLRALHESVLVNVYGVADVKVLVEGAEVETLGGHISLSRALGDIVTQTILQE
jgi:spore germination protein GerM